MSEMKVPMIYGLIQKAMGMVGAIGKDSAATNYNGKMMYKFRGIDAVYNALNPVMAELGLFIIPEILEQRREERTSSNGTTLIYSIVTVKFTMYAPDGSSVSGTVIGEGMDSGDKATNKAMSIAMKYFCFQTFMIPTEEMKNMDPDAEVHEVMPKKTQAPPVTPPQKAEVTTSKVLPKNENPQAYIQNEIAFMAQKRGIDTKTMGVEFKKMRAALIEGGAIEDIPSDQMTMEQAKQLIAAIHATFPEDEPA